MLVASQWKACLLYPQTNFSYVSIFGHMHVHPIVAASQCSATYIRHLLITFSYHTVAPPSTCTGPCLGGLNVIVVPLPWVLFPGGTVGPVLRVPVFQVCCAEIFRGWSGDKQNFANFGWHWPEMVSMPVGEGFIAWTWTQKKGGAEDIRKPYFFRKVIKQNSAHYSAISAIYHAGLSAVPSSKWGGCNPLPQ